MNPQPDGSDDSSDRQGLDFMINNAVLMKASNTPQCEWYFSLPMDAFTDSYLLGNMKPCANVLSTPPESVQMSSVLR